MSIFSVGCRFDGGHVRKAFDFRTVLYFEHRIQTEVRTCLARGGAVSTEASARHEQKSACKKAARTL